MSQNEEPETKEGDHLPQNNNKKGGDVFQEPHRWCIAYQQLLDVAARAEEIFGPATYRQSITMREVNREIIIPVCQSTGKSYALSVNPQGLEIDAFCTHCWDGLFDSFVRSIKSIFQTSIVKPNLWICAFALVQGVNPSLIRKQVGSNEEPLTNAPFVKALQHANTFCVVRNANKDLYSRIWCVCEAMYAKKWGLYPLHTHVTGPDVFAHIRTSCVNAEATMQEDKERILNVLLAEHLVQEIDAIVQQFRNHDAPEAQENNVGLPSTSSSTRKLTINQESSRQQANISKWMKETKSGKAASSSLVQPTRIEAINTSNSNATPPTSTLEIRQAVTRLLDQCESTRKIFKKKLLLNNLNLTIPLLPVQDLCGTPLGQSLHTLSLAGNPLQSIPIQLVNDLPALRRLDLSHCMLQQLPNKWHLPNCRELDLSQNQLTQWTTERTVWDLPNLNDLNLSKNRLILFPPKAVLLGMPTLQVLNLYGNKIAVINLSPNSFADVLTNLETLNLGYNDVSTLPDEIDAWRSLRTLILENNYLNEIPARVCFMPSLRRLDASSNPLIEPPQQTCDKGIKSMRRYYESKKKLARNSQSCQN